MSRLAQVALTLIPIVAISLFAAQLPGRPESLFDQGNSSYQEGDFAAAEKYYRQVLQSGFENGSLYFNLGNACFKQKKLGEAIYYWEKARRKMPRDPEVREEAGSPAGSH